MGLHISSTHMVYKIIKPVSLVEKFEITYSGTFLFVRRFEGIGNA